MQRSKKAGGRYQLAAECLDDEGEYVTLRHYQKAFTFLKFEQRCNGADGQYTTSNWKLRVRSLDWGTRCSSARALVALPALKRDNLVSMHMYASFVF